MGLRVSEEERPEGERESLSERERVKERERAMREFGP